MPRSVKNDLSGRKFGRLLALKFLPDDSRHSKFMCRCDCGANHVAYGQALISGATKSCGCLRAIDPKFSHGHTRHGRHSPTYKTWAGMMTRGEWGHHPSYAKYGAVGIKVDPRWHVFENFLLDMGERPGGTSLDRIDNDKGYSKENCRWATRSVQDLNKSSTRKVVYDGKETPVKTLAESLGISTAALRARAVRAGNDYVRAFGSYGIVVGQPQSNKHGDQNRCSIVFPKEAT